jgi:hypothetical protein
VPASSLRSYIGLCYEFIYMNPKYDFVVVMASARQIFFSVEG